MPQSSKPEAHASIDDPACLARTVCSMLQTEPSLEAVCFDPEKKSIAVATIGQADVSGIMNRVTTSMESLGREASPHCGLISGEGDCLTCIHGLTKTQHQTVTIRRDGGSTTIARVTCPTAPNFWRWRNFPWPKLMAREVDMDIHEEHPDEWKAQMAAAILCLAFGLTAYFLKGNPASLYFHIAAYLAGGWFTAQEVWERLEHRAIDVHFLMLAVAAGSASIGAWGEGATLLFLFSFSGALEHYALGRTQREISSLFKDAPKVATVLDAAGNELELKVESLNQGMRLLIKPGAQFPVDAEVIVGKTAADESNLTGESVAVDKSIGDTVLAGTMNLWGAVEVLVLRPASQSALQKIIRLIKDAQKQKAPAQQFTDKFSTHYTYGALGLSLTMFFVWWKGFGYPPFHGMNGIQSAFYHTMALLVVSSPCALVLSIPSAVLAAIAWGAKHGILFRGGAAVEKLASIQVVALDKTGTLTTGELRVEKVESFPKGDETAIATIACGMEKLSNHPLARAIAKYGRQHNMPTPLIEHFESINGQGLKAECQGEKCLVGRREWIAGETHSKVLETIPPVEAGFNEVWVVHGSRVGRLILRDDIRPESAQVIRELEANGLESLVLTGDRQATADFLKHELQLPEVRAELKPEDKVAAIRAIVKSGRKVAMVGDGVNDAPSLAAADVGVAMGGRGADAALEQADVVLMHDKLENFLAAYKLSQRARNIIRQNLFISLGTVVVLVCVALAGKIPLTLGVVGHEGSTVVVVLNSLRLLFHKSDSNFSSSKA